MKKKYKKFNISGDMTLTSIANRIGITPEELKKFHNDLCQKQEMIYFDNLKGLEFVLIPTNYKIPKEEEFSLETERPYYPYSQKILFKNYAVIETYEKPNQTKQEIRYSIHIDFPENKDSSFINFSITDFVKFDEKSSDKLTELSMLCMQSLYPLSILLSENGTMLRLHHHKNLVEKFEKNRNKLEDFFTGYSSNQYLNLFYKNISDENYFFYQLKSNLLYQTIFPDMKWFHKDKSWVQPFYIQQNSFPSDCIFHADYLHLDENIEINIQGLTSEKITSQEIVLGKKMDDITNRPMKGKINLRYVIRKKDKMLLKAETTISLLYENELLETNTIEIVANTN